MPPAGTLRVDHTEVPNVMSGGTNLTGQGDSSPSGGQSGAGRLRRVALVAVAVLGLFTLYEVVTSIFAYTADAYVDSDLVALAPEVTGRIVSVQVIDNQTVRRGDLLAEIDPVPFRLALRESSAALVEAHVQLSVDQYAIASAQDALTAAAAAANYAQGDQARLATLATSDDVSRADLEQADDVLRRANAALDSAKSNVSSAQASIAIHQAAQARIEAAVALAEWRLSRTNLVAPTDGTITNLSLRGGDTAQANVPLIGIVDSHAWRIVANYKESYIRNFATGDTAWVWLDADPWKLHHARVTGVARGISREQTAGQLLAYVAPTTDWIRLQRRFPVTLTLVDTSAGLPLFMGSDARVVILP
jgi:multidrug efflux system membrane fusion protein